MLDTLTLKALHLTLVVGLSALARFAVENPIFSLVVSAPLLARLGFGIRSALARRAVAREVRSLGRRAVSIERELGEIRTLLGKPQGVGGKSS